MLWLLAQLVDPALQPGPVRLPSAPALERPGPGTQLSPEIKGLIHYSPEALEEMLGSCSQEQDRLARLNACAAALTAQFVTDGYVNSRVYVETSPPPGRLEVVEGQLVEVRVQCNDPSLAKRVRRLLAPLQQGPLHLPSLEAALLRLKQQPEIANVRASLGRLGSDPTRAVLNLVVIPAPNPLQGEFSLRNDGNPGTGEARGLLAVQKKEVLSRNDNLFFYGELDSDNTRELGYMLGSISYTAPLNDKLSLTGAFGFSRRQLVEVEQPLHELSYRQLQGYGQLNWSLAETLDQQWYAFAGLSVNRNDVFLDGRSIPLIVGGGDYGWLRTGFLRAGLGFNGNKGTLAWGGNIYGLQGLAGLSTPHQLSNLGQLGVYPGEARAIGAVLAASWAPESRLQINLRGATQLALAELTSDMGFTLGSDAGLRGLPGQLVSGDNGYLGNIELVWTAWKGARNRFQLVPFIGAGGVQSERNGTFFQDTAGSGGILGRWLQGNRWSLEIGWVSPFQTEEQELWNDWLLSKGLYTQFKLRF
jgi:hemolysin activation/secretion protein